MKFFFVVYVLIFEIKLIVRMIPQDQLTRLENEIYAMTIDGLKTLQCLSDTLLCKSLLEGLKINRYRCRRSVTRDLSIGTIRSIIQEAILDKTYDAMIETMSQ